MAPPTDFGEWAAAHEHQFAPLNVLRIPHIQQEMLTMIATVSLAIAALLGTGIAAQSADSESATNTFGTRHIDTLPSSDYAEDVWTSRTWETWSEEERTAPHLQVHLKPTFRPNDNGLERLCVVEAATPNRYRQYGVLRFITASQTIEHSIDWLAKKTQYRPMPLPVLPSDINAELIVDGEKLAEDTFNTSQGAPEGAYRISVDDRPQYTDHGYGLLPSDWLFARRGQKIRIQFAPNPKNGGKTQMRAGIRDGDGNWVCTAATTFHSSQTPICKLAVSTAKLSTGRYNLFVRADCPNDVTVGSKRVVRIVGGNNNADTFGVFWERLHYPAPVYTSGDRVTKWNWLWRNRTLRDIVVRWPEGNRRLVFWRGASYVPCWAFNNTWVTFGWLEAEPDFYGAVGCVEPIMDRNCRRSHVRIVSENDARVIVEWRYALMDYHKKVIRDEHAEERYYLYPDATGTRKLIAHIKSGWHETQEFIALNRAGNPASKSLKPQAVTLLNTQGDSERPVWPRPFLDVDDWSEVICRVNVANQPAPFMTVDRSPTSVKVWADPYVDKPDLFNTYTHWPISRGMRTTWANSSADWQRPSHSNLLNIVNEAVEETDDAKIWYWLIGLSETERQAKQFSASWLNPGTVSTNYGAYAGYDRSQKAYIFDAPADASKMQISVTPGDTAIVNPAFVIRDVPRSLNVCACEKAERIETGKEAGGKNLVVWLQGTFEDPFDLLLH